MALQILLVCSLPLLAVSNRASANKPGSGPVVSPTPRPQQKEDVVRLQSVDHAKSARQVTVKPLTDDNESEYTGCCHCQSRAEGGQARPAHRSCTFLPPSAAAETCNGVCSTKRHMAQYAFYVDRSCQDVGWCYDGYVAMNAGHLRKDFVPLDVLVTETKEEPTKVIKVDPRIFIPSDYEPWSSSPGFENTTLPATKGIAVEPWGTFQKSEAYRKIKSTSGQKELFPECCVCSLSKEDNINNVPFRDRRCIKTPTAPLSLSAADCIAVCHSLGGHMSYLYSSDLTRQAEADESPSHPYKHGVNRCETAGRCAKIKWIKAHQWVGGQRVDCPSADVKDCSVCGREGMAAGGVWAHVRCRRLSGEWLQIFQRGTDKELREGTVVAALYENVPSTLYVLTRFDR
ncbi:unnamed protein product [Vitrella brassicaformis CCMP3155]|uniref:Uncharacterized protein n=1 Tax=Vitrella brassicaformis (strain CCMP3155) TaxID=1169540 RepID=A0A0G4EY90_VITBC|nr:unnamed protein product [Vitrella brassicaformis CCMP3155]|eukprot:CEM03599.1 unnamed protein product [Vitrella brassicaformis CCMP3155]